MLRLWCWLPSVGLAFLGGWLEPTMEIGTPGAAPEHPVLGTALTTSSLTDRAISRTCERAASSTSPSRCRLSSSRLIALQCSREMATPGRFKMFGNFDTPDDLLGAALIILLLLLLLLTAPILLIPMTLLLPMLLVLMELMVLLLMMLLDGGTGKLMGTSVFTGVKYA